MNSENQFEKNFDYNSFLPLLLFILGIYISYLFVIKNFSQGILMMMIAFVVYVLNNVIVNKNKNSTLFNEYLEDMAVFVAFGIAPSIFGFVFYSENMFILIVVFFYSVCQILNLARNWVLSAKNSRGWPAPLNGIFFPLIYYVFIFYLQDPGDSIFIIYFILVGFFSISEHNYLGYEKKEETESENEEEEIVAQNNIGGWRENVRIEKQKELERARDQEIQRILDNEKKEKLKKENSEDKIPKVEENKKSFFSSLFKKKSDAELKEQEIQKAKEIEEKEKLERIAKEKKSQGKLEVEQNKKSFFSSLFKKKSAEDLKKEEIEKTKDIEKKEKEKQIKEIEDKAKKEEKEKLAKEKEEKKLTSDKKKWFEFSFFGKKDKDKDKKELKENRE